MTTSQRLYGHGGGGSHWVNTHHVQNLSDHHQQQQRLHPRAIGVDGCFKQPSNYGHMVQNHPHSKRLHHADRPHFGAFKHAYLGRRGVPFPDHSMLTGYQLADQDLHENGYMDMSNNESFSQPGFYYPGGVKNFAESRTRTLSMTSTKSGATTSSAPKHPELMKTILCENWAKGRNCRFGTNCWYAHGDYELRDSHIPLTSYDTQFSATQAQHEWIMRSHGQDIHAKPDNRFMRDTINAQLRASVEACLREGEKDNDDESQDEPKQSIEEKSSKDALGFALLSNVVNNNGPKLPHHEDSGNESAAEAEADIFSNCGSWSDLMKALKKNNDNCIVGPAVKTTSEGSTTVTAFAANAKETDSRFRDHSVFLDVCPMYSAAGYCALGVDCMFAHCVKDM